MGVRRSLLSALAFTVALNANSSPIVTLPYGSFQGQVVGTTTEFRGMPFAAPPYVVGPFLNVPCN